jgi:cobalt/nickel transport system permease protein
MHLPDGFISVPVAVSTGILSGGVLWVALKKSSSSKGSRHAIVLGLTTAFIFAAQMINFPVLGGTSGHLLGGGLAGALLGCPWSAILSITTVLIIQAVLFADGGITALGANILTMGIVSVLMAWVLSRTLLALFGGRKKYLPIAYGIGAAISVLGTSLVCGILLSLSGISKAGIVIPSMAGIHIFIGIGEGIITGTILAYLVKVRPDLLPGGEEAFKGFFTPIVLIFLLAGVLSLFASALPDGLESVALDLGFFNLAEDSKNVVQSPFSKYEIIGMGQIGRSITGLLGAMVCFGIAYGLAKIVKEKNA